MRRRKRGHGREAEVLTTETRRDATKAARAEHTDTFEKIFFSAVEHSQEVSPETRTSLREERGGHRRLAAVGETPPRPELGWLAAFSEGSLFRAQPRVAKRG